MGVRFPSVFSITPIAVLPASGAQTIIIITPQLTLPLDGAAVFVTWFWNGNTGAGTTQLTVTINRSLSPGVNVIMQNVQPVTAGVNFSMSGVAVDPNPGASAGVQYNMALQGTGTTGAGGNGAAHLAAFVL